MKKKTIALILALCLIAGGMVGGTLAYLTDKTEEVKNTFTVGNIDIDLAETKTDFKMVPGYTIEKDPKVTVEANSEKCYVFVKVEESDNLDTYIEYTIDYEWTKLTGVDGVDNVWYRVVEANAEDQVFSVLSGDKVTVRDTVTKEKMDELTEATLPTLTFTAYACQYMKDNDNYFNAAEAWAKVDPPATGE